jgi:hypothetical protein
MFLAHEAAALAPKASNARAAFGSMLDMLPNQPAPLSGMSQAEAYDTGGSGGSSIRAFQATLRNASQAEAAHRAADVTSAASHAPFREKKERLFGEDASGGEGARESANVVPQHRRGQPSGGTSSTRDIAEVGAGAAADGAASGMLADVQVPTTEEAQGGWWDNLKVAASDAWNATSSAVSDAWNATTAAYNKHLKPTVDHVTDRVGDALDLRKDEAAKDAWEDWQAASTARSNFIGKTHAANNFQSESGLGLFDATYDPGAGSLNIALRVKFNFTPGRPSDFPSAAPETLVWDDASKTSWQTQWASQVEAAWSGKHTFHCQKKHWEDLFARVTVSVVAVDSGEHYAVNVARIPPGEFQQSSVSIAVPGTGTFDSEDLTPKSGSGQVGAVHESGHMLGLDDEYTEACNGEPSHADMAQADYGVEVTCGDNNRLMSGGNDVPAEYGVTFLAALRAATNLDEWGPTARPLTPPAPAPP